MAYRKSRSGPVVWAAMLLFVLGAGVEYMLHLHGLKVEQESRLGAVVFAAQLRAQVDRELNAAIFLTSGLSSYLTVRHDTLNPRELERILAAIHSGTRHIRNFGIAVGYRLTYVYPIAGNEPAISLDYRDQPQQWPAVRRTIEGRKPVLVQGVELVQGGTGIIYRVPIYIEGHYWGLLSTVIDCDSVLSAAFKDSRDSLFEFAVMGSDGSGGPGKVLWGRPELLAEPNVVTADSDNGWRFVVKSRGTNSGALMGWLVRGLGWAFALAAAVMAYLALEHRESLTYLALVDPLTGLPNRRLLDDRIEQAVARSGRHPDTPCALLFVDLDGFKAINDRHGHRAGDAVLQAAAARVRRCVRGGDTVGRWGGDEFVVLANELEIGELEQLVLRLRAAVEAPVDHEGKRFRVGASIGWAMSPRDTNCAHELIRLADRAMYDDKTLRKTGRTVTASTVA